MPTINSKDIVDEIIKNNGHYEDDPIVLLVSEYTNDWGKQTYHLAYSLSEIQSLLSSPYVHNIKFLWSNPEHSICLEYGT